MYIGNKAFSNCKSLTHLIVPETISVLGSFVFAGCNALKELKLPERFNNQMDELLSDIEMEDDLDLDS
jgi:hypothetical protein